MAQKENSMFRKKKILGIGDGGGSKSDYKDCFRSQK